MKDFAAAHCLRVTALGLWQCTNGTTHSADAVADDEFSACLKHGPYMSVRCDMAPELDNKEIGPWFGALVFGDHSQFKYAAGTTKEIEKPVVVGMALACHTEGTGGQKIGQMHLPDNGRNNKGGRCEVDCSPTMVLEIQVRDNDNFHYSKTIAKRR